MSYLTTRAYPDFFHAEQSPPWQRAVLAALGRKAPTGKGWCEIGCGQGLGTTLLAAADPSLRVVGIDINPAHVEVARARAAAAGLRNIEFICADIRELALPETFGHVVCHGVLSWVAPSVRAGIADFIARHLSPDGVAALHYMAQPGGLAFRAFHGVFRALAHRPDPIAEGLDLLSRMRAAQAGFFQLHPHAGQALDRLLAEDADYLAHEYLNPDFEPLAFGDVQRLMQGHDLGFLGSATPIENIDAISLPAAGQADIAKVADATLRETLKDLSRNQVMRYDLYARPAPAPDDAAHLDLLRGIAWGWLPGAPDLSRASANLTFNSRIGPVEGDIRVLGPLFATLAQGAAQFGRIERVPPFAGRPGLLNQTLQMALWARMAHPVQAAADAGPAGALNRILLAEAARGRAVPALAAPALGSGLALGRADMVLLAEGRAAGLARLFGL